MIEFGGHAPLEKGMSAFLHNHFDTERIEKLALFGDGVRSARRAKKPVFSAIVSPWKKRLLNALCR